MPVYQNADGSFDINVCVRRRRLHRRLPAGTSARDAKQLEAELKAALGREGPPIPGDPALTDVMGEYLKHAKTLRSPDTAAHHAVRIGQWCIGHRASEARQVRARIIDDMTGHYAPATINRSLGALKKGLRIAWEHGRTPVDYSTMIKRLPEHNQMADYLTLEQVKSIADHASEPVRVAIWVSLLTGCRRGEVCKIQPADIGRTHIRIEAGNTKTLRYRQAPIFPALRPWLKHLPLGITFEGVKSGWQRARLAAGLPKARFHALRHSCATILLAPPISAPLHVVRDILGHTTIKTTERYAHAMVEPQRKALAQLGRLHQMLHQKPKKGARNG